MTNFVTRAKFNILSLQQWIAHFENIRYSVEFIGTYSGMITFFRELVKRFMIVCAFQGLNKRSLT